MSESITMAMGHPAGSAFALRVCTDKPRLSPPSACYACLPFGLSAKSTCPPRS